MAWVSYEHIQLKTLFKTDIVLCYVPSENLKILSLGRNNIKVLSGLVSFQQ